jgi:serine/threonine-protein kinase HipA
MKRTIGVALGNSGRRIGVLRYNRDGARESASFEYNAEWLAAPDRFRIDPALPLVAGPQFHKRREGGSIFPGTIADSGPDGWAAKVILRDHGKRRALAKAAGEAQPALAGAMDFLLEVDDFSRVGALRFCDEEGIFRRPREDGGRAAPPLIELDHLLSSSRAVEMNTETEADLAYLRGRGTSLQGVRPKCTVLDDDGGLSIGKFPSVKDERAVTKAEILALTLAADAGIRAAHGRLVSSDGVPVALVRRFDRGDGERLMYLSAATLMGATAGEHTEHTYAEMVDTIRVYGAAPQADIEELWRRIAFSILITNVDDHLHNHGFLHVERETWRLAPAFDVNPFPDKLRELKTWVSEETGPAATVEALMSAVPYFGLKLDRARQVLGEVESAVAQWRTRGAELGMTVGELDEFVDAFEHDERLAAQAESAHVSARAARKSGHTVPHSTTE